MNKKDIFNSLLVFLFIGTALTSLSTFILQDIGLYKKVSGWPLTMYEIEYDRTTSIDTDGQISHEIVEKGKNLLWDKVMVNIVIWTLILEGTWIVYHQVFNKKKSRSV